MKRALSGRVVPLEQPATWTDGEVLLLIEGLGDCAEAVFAFRSKPSATTRERLKATVETRCHAATERSLADRVPSPIAERKAREVERRIRALAREFGGERSPVVIRARAALRQSIEASGRRTS